MAAAEDALATALEKALALWPTQGVPETPDAWLLTVARRELLQAERRDRLHASPLTLLFVCAHPAIDAAVRPALMLQAVLGLQAQQIAQAMLTSPAAMAQRLVRAKQKIRDAGLRFDEPGPDEWPGRLHAVLAAVYAAYGLGWDAIDSADSGEGDDAGVQGLRSEALFLADLVCSLLPARAHRAEAEGLLALILFCEARAAARRGPDGGFVPLAEQDTACWQLDVIEQGNRVLAGAAAWGAPGPYQLEAAIQSAHCQRRVSGITPWAGIALLYQRRLATAPSLGAEVAHAVAGAQAGDVQRALALLTALDSPRLASYQPFWVAQGPVAALAGHPEQARAALQRAVGLTGVPAVRPLLLGRLQALGD